MNKEITVQMVRSWNPCYDPTEVVPEDWTGTALDVLELGISASDKLWIVLRNDVLPKALMREFARWCALQVIDLWDATDVVKEYLKTGDENKRAAASTAAWAGARAAAARAGVAWAARAAAWAAQDAAWAAAWDAAWAAEQAGARAAAWEAGLAAGRAAARAGQVVKLKEMIKAYEVETT